MKRYSISYFCRETKRFSYSGRTDNPAEVIERYKPDRDSFGLQIRDSVTKEIIFSEVRPIKGKLILTLTDGKRTWSSTREFVDLSYMREREHDYRYNYNRGLGTEYSHRVVKIEREICG